MMRFLTLLLLTFLASPVLAADELNIEKIMADRVLGKADAPVTMIEYASLTCGHCADFSTKVLPELQKQAVDTGKLKIIYRDFPLDGMALKAAALARCLPEDRYFAFIHMLFDRQQVWARSEDPTKALVRMAALAGLGPDQANACMNNQKILEAITAGRTKATEQYKVESTPTFIFNDDAVRVNGTKPLAEYLQAVEKLETPNKPATAPVKP